MNDRIFLAAVRLKKELADLKNPELDSIMNEIMKTIADHTVADPKQKKQ